MDIPIAYLSPRVSLAKLHLTPFRNSTITMTIAFAIVFSVLLAISVWLIEKRSAWKKAGKFFLYGLGVVVVVPLLRSGLKSIDGAKSWRNNVRFAEP